MKRQDLAASLMFAAEIEESHTPVVARMFLEDFSWEGVEEDKVARVKEILSVIKAQTMEHERIVEGLLKKVREDGRDEF